MYGKNAKYPFLSVCVCAPAQCQSSSVEPVFLHSLKSMVSYLPSDGHCSGQSMVFYACRLVCDLYVTCMHMELYKIWYSNSVNCSVVVVLKRCPAVSDHVRSR